MGLLYKISVFCFLFLSVPAGKLFDIFQWDINIIKSEQVVSETSSDLLDKTFILTQLNEVQTDEKPDRFLIQIYRLALSMKSSESKIVCHEQNHLFRNIKTALNDRFLFNIIYSEDHSA